MSLVYVCMRYNRIIMISASATDMMRLEHHAQQMQLKSQQCHQGSSSSRILDIPCKVCGDYSSGKHYNIFACDGCAGFFKRSIRRNRRYICKSKDEGSCVIDKAHRNQCRACRLQKCQEAGMNKDAVQHERGPRNSTIRKAMSTFFEHQQRAFGAFGGRHSDIRPMISPSGGGGVLDLALPKPTLSPSSAQHMEPPPPPMLAGVPLMPHGAYGYMPRLPAVAFQAPPMMSPPVTPPPAVMTPEEVCESAARLLFLNVQWAQHLPYFTGLPISDQLLLLEEGWKDLFVLGATQFLPLIDLTPLMQASDAFKTEGSSTFAKGVKDFQETLVYAKQFNLDPHEFSCLRVISLFKPPGSLAANESRGLIEERSVLTIANEAQVSLSKYIGTTRSHDTLRFSKECLLLSKIRAISADAIEGLFFQKAVGKIPIVKIIADMYRNQRS